MANSLLSTLRSLNHHLISNSVHPLLRNRLQMPICPNTVAKTTIALPVANILNLIKANPVQGSTFATIAAKHTIFHPVVQQTLASHLSHLASD